MVNLVNRQGMSYKAGSANCNFGNFGCKAAAYPGTGNVAWAEHNVYIDSSAKGPFSLKIDFGTGHNLLAAIPLHGPEGWTGEVNPDGTLKVGTTTQPYLFYAARGDESPLQNTNGFCETNDKIVDRLATYLEENQFPPRAVTDFRHAWNRGLEGSTFKGFCIYPQDVNEVQKVAPMTMPQAHAERRVWFLAVPQVEEVAYKGKVKDATRKWFKKPAQDAFAVLKKRVSDRKIANETVSTGELKVSEWAIGFLLE
jgi:hypothetical protein